MTTPLAAEAAASAGAGAEVWLRGNARPAVGLLAAVLAVTAVTGTAVVAIAPPWWVGAAVAALAALVAVVAAVLVWAARLPRLVRAGDVVEIRLSPLGCQRVPLDVVECVFPGSQALADEAVAPDAGRRVTTLVLRLAERATDWRSRPVAAAWGTWDDGNVVFDGRWCEPLSPALAREISARLLEAKRAAAPGGDA